MAENPLDFLPDARIVHAHLRQEMEVIEVRAAIVRAEVVADHPGNPFHGSVHPRYILPDKFRQRVGRGGELAFRFVHSQHVFVRHGNEQVQLVREIIDDARLGQPAGFGNGNDACLLVIHPEKHPECLVNHFFTVCYHTPLFLIGHEDTDLISIICNTVIF